MRNFIKKLTIVLIAATMSFAANAQLEEGDLTGTVKGVVGFGQSYTNFGAGVKLTYNIFESFRLAGDFEYFFKKDFVSMWDAMAYVQYVFKVSETAGIYPLIGAGIAGASADLVDETFTDFMSAAGIGADFMLSDKISLNLEFKVQFDKNFDTRFIGGIGIAFKF